MNAHITDMHVLQILKPISTFFCQFMQEKLIFGSYFAVYIIEDWLIEVQIIKVLPCILKIGSR